MRVMRDHIGLEILKHLRSSINLKKHLFVAWGKHVKNLFEAFIAAILSQNTSDKNAFKAFMNLKKKLGEITPNKIQDITLEDLADCIRPAGLYQRRAQTIKKLAEVFDERKVRKIFEMPVEKARLELMKLPGVGEKTADVILMFYAKKPTIPVDTHISRVSKRIGIVSDRARYNEIREALMSIFPQKHYIEAHLYLIALGREYCKARNPKCDICPIKHICKYASSKFT